MSNGWDFGAPRAPQGDTPLPAPGGALFGASAGSRGGDLFDAPGGFGVPVGPPQVTRPPLELLAAGCAVAGLGLLLAVLASGRPLLALVAWLLGGFAAAGLLGVFTLRDGRRRVDPWYAASTAVPVLRVLLLALALAAVSTSAWRFADVVARSPR